MIDCPQSQKVKGGAQMNYMGIDYHKQYSHITLMDEKGKKLKSGRVANYHSEVEKFLNGTGDAKAVIESGRSSYTMVDIMDELGIEITIAHPLEGIKGSSSLIIRGHKGPVSFFLIFPLPPQGQAPCWHWHRGRNSGP